MTPQLNDEGINKDFIANKFLNEVLSDIPLPILILSGESVIDCNTSAIRLFHASESMDIINRPLILLSASHQPDGNASGPLLASLLGQITSGKNIRFEWVFTKRDGKEFD